MTARVRRLEEDLDERALDRKGIPAAERPAWRRALAADRTAARALLEQRPDAKPATPRRERALSDAEYEAAAQARFGFEEVV